MIDTDNWNDGGKINILRNFVQEKNSDYEGWFVVQSNPCFEIWLYYHFKTEKPNIDIVNTFISFKKFVDSEIAGGFDKRSMPLAIENACLNSEAVYISSEVQPNLYCTEVFRLGKQIIKFTKKQLDKCIEDIQNNKT